ncbi:MAG TPA: hypothetical protein VFK33_14510 [Bacillales bacterium]|nr:hypothetical protein [Bacillales bacterium]
MPALQWPIQIQKVGRGPDSTMKEALMKKELEVIADPKGTAVNLSLVHPSLVP